MHLLAFMAISFLSTSHPVFFISMDRAHDQHLLHRLLGPQSGAQRVEGVAPVALPNHAHGFDKRSFDPTKPGMRKIATLLSHLEAMRSISHAIPCTPENDHAAAVVVQGDASLHFAHVWQSRGLSLNDFVTAAPADWQVVQLASTGGWHLLDRWPLEAPPPLMLARWTGSGPVGMGCYAVRVATARYFARAFWRDGKWDVLRYLVDAEKRIDVSLPLPELFFYSRAVAYSSLASPVASTLDDEMLSSRWLATTEHAAEAQQHARCEREMLSFRWRLWAARNAREASAKADADASSVPGGASTSTRTRRLAVRARRRADEAGADSKRAPPSKSHRVFTSRQIVRYLVARERVSACNTTEQKFRRHDDSRQRLVEHLRQRLGGNGTIRFSRPGRALLRRALANRRRQLRSAGPAAAGAFE